MDPFDALAASSSAPFASRASGEELRVAFLTASPSGLVEPHVERALAELPIEMLARMIEAYPQQQRAQVIANLYVLAERFGTKARIAQWLNGRGCSIWP